mmetsp:Transcript_577/g.2299  ORF Transcript_577/g.2299 Transcript_577/m.2299 type:complete len:379 (+) Transcript_577:762-1898(+)
MATSAHDIVTARNKLLLVSKCQAENAANDPDGEVFAFSREIIAAVSATSSWSSHAPRSVFNDSMASMSCERAKYHLGDSTTNITLNASATMLNKAHVNAKCLHLTSSGVSGTAYMNATPFTTAMCGKIECAPRNFFGAASASNSGAAVVTSPIDMPTKSRPAMAPGENASLTYTAHHPATAGAVAATTALRRPNLSHTHPANSAPTMAPINIAMCIINNSSLVALSRVHATGAPAEHVVADRVANGNPIATPTVKQANDTDAVAAHVRQDAGTIRRNASDDDGDIKCGTRALVCLSLKPRSASSSDRNASLVSLPRPSVVDSNPLSRRDERLRSSQSFSSITSSSSSPARSLFVRVVPLTVTPSECSLSLSSSLRRRR